MDTRIRSLVLLVAVVAACQPPAATSEPRGSVEMTPGQPGATAVAPAVPDPSFGPDPTVPIPSDVELGSSGVPVAPGVPDPSFGPDPTVPPG